jgi:hypothetical protein
MKVGEIWECVREDDEMLGHLSPHYGTKVLGHKVEIIEMNHMWECIGLDIRLTLEHIDRKDRHIVIERPEFLRCFKRVYNEDR